jgi:uncharacterized membrane protein
MRVQKVVRGTAMLFAAVLIAGAGNREHLRAAGDRSETLIYAVYNGQDTASQVFKTMKSAQNTTGERIESYAVVAKDLKGKVKIVDQRKRDAGVGAVLGGVIGLVGGPIGVAAGATAGGAMGYLTGDAVGIPRDKVESMKQSLTPDSSALVVVLDDKWVQDVEHGLSQANARAVIANQIASK